MAANTVEELEKQYQTNDKTTTTTTTTTTTLPKYEAQVDAVNKVYDTANSASLAALENAYNQSKVQAEAAKEKIPATYQAQANSISAQSERNRQAFNESAGAAGLNVGAGSQAALAQNNQLQADLTKIRTAEANAKQDIDNQLNLLYTTYQGNIAEALANNEYERANALMNEYQQAASSAVTVGQNQIMLDRQLEQQQYDRAADQAANLAKFGDFSGYKALGYTDAQIAAMTSAWALANPELAAQLGIGTGTGTGVGTGTGTGDTYTGDDYVPNPDGADGNGNKKFGINFYMPSYSQRLNSGESRENIVADIQANYAAGNMDATTYNTLMSTFNKETVQFTYDQVESVAAEQLAQGMSSTEILAEAEENMLNGLITPTDYQRLKASMPTMVSEQKAADSEQKVNAEFNSYYNRYSDGESKEKIVEEINYRVRTADLSYADGQALLARFDSLPDKVAESDGKVQMYVDQYNTSLHNNADVNTVQADIYRRLASGELTNAEAIKIMELTTNAYNSIPTDWVIG